MIAGFARRPPGALWPDIAVAAIYLAAMALLISMFAIIGPMLGFSVCLAVAVFLFRPRLVFDPITILTGYYALYYWAPLYASRYNGLPWDHPDVVAAYQMAASTYAIGAAIFFLFRPRSGGHPVLQQGPPDTREIEWFALCNLVVCLCLGGLLFQMTGGVDRWLELGGKAIMRREGAGIVVIPFIFASLMEFTVLGYLAFVAQRWRYLLLGGVLLVILGPLLSSRIRIIQAILLLGAPMLLNARIMSKRALGIAIVAVSVFLIFSAWRAGGTVELQKLIPKIGEDKTFVSVDSDRKISFEYKSDHESAKSFTVRVLNYFDILENQIVALRDFEPASIMTIAMPFKKLSLFQGIDYERKEYDLSAYLTHKYYLGAYLVGATTQWPIETDLWLSFGYPFGWVLLVPFFVVFAAIYRFAYACPPMPGAFLWVFFGFYLTAHLRGGYFLWTDFYAFPLAFICAALLWLLPQSGVTRNDG